MSKNGDFIVKYTNKDIMKKLDDMDEKIDKVHEQALKTNGRVNNLELKSIGLWISNNPFKFAIGLLAFTAIVISDIRHPVIEFLLKLF